MGTASQLALVGRARERNALERWLDAVAAGKAGLALVEGEAGIGKTRLADSVRAAATGRSFDVLSGRADELDHGRPFGLLIDALGLALAAGGSASVVPGAEFRAIDRLVEQVEVRALKGPVAIVLEDLQWADPGTVVGLRAVSRRLAHLPLALLGTFRPWPRSRELERLIEAWRADAAVHLVLGPLDHSEVVELASRLLGGQPDPELERQLASAAGNPLFVRELVGALSEEGAIGVLDGRAMLAERSLPPSLRLTILRRIGLLGDATASLLRSASLLGTRFSLADLATVSGRSATALVDELLEARRAGVVEESGALLRFRHALVRDAIYSDLPESVRQALHRDAGMRLAEAGAPALQVAEQLSLGATPGDADAVRWLSQTAREWVLRAPQTAVELFERATELAVGGSASRDDLLAELADALVWAGRPDQGHALAAELLARSVPAGTRERARRTVVRGLWLEGRWRELLQEVDSWLRTSEFTDVERAPLLADAAMACVFIGDTGRAESLALEALSIGEALGEDAIVFRALYALTPIHNFSGRYEAELAASERALAITERDSNPDLVRFHPHFGVAMSLNSNDRYEDAERMFATGLRVREALGTVWDLPLYQAGLADLHCQMGKWDEALAEAETGVAIAEEVGTRLGIVVCAAVAALVRGHRDELPAAERHLAIAQREIDRAGPQWGTYWVILAAAQVAEARADPDGALAALSDGWTAHEHSPGIQVYLGPELVRLALPGDPHRARSVAEAVSSRAAQMRVASAEGSALLCRGRVDDDPAVLARAVDAFRAAGWLLELATACEASATALARAGDLSAARSRFEEALDLYERLDARRAAARALGSMRAGGLRRGSRAAHRRALKGWEALTEMERQVVRLTVEGLTNREIAERLFVSRRTVQTHLSHAFAKLEVSSRVQLAAAAARRTPA